MPRPSVEVDLAEVEKLGALQCTYEEVAAWFKVEKRTVVRWMKKADIAEAFERGKASGRTSLRRAQFQAAMKGNPALLIWLGKQLLNQQDKITTEHEGEVTVHDGAAAREQLISKLTHLASSGRNPESDQRIN